jgi:ribosomal protein S18 acetylase RimI-like enzyme
MIFRRANKDDIPQMLPLWRELADIHAVMEPMFIVVDDAEEKFANHLLSLIDKENVYIPVAVIDSEVVGYGIATTSIRPDVFAMRRRLHVQDVIVSPKHRRKGIAEGIVDRIKEYAKEQQIEKMDLLVAVQNETADKFWKEMGFKPALNHMNLYLS